MRSTIPLSEERLLSILACGLSSFGFLKNLLCIVHFNADIEEQEYLCLRVPHDRIPVLGIGDMQPFVGLVLGKAIRMGFFFGCGIEQGAIVQHNCLNAIRNDTLCGVKAQSGRRCDRIQHALHEPSRGVLVPGTDAPDRNDHLDAEAGDGSVGDSSTVPFKHD
jgi:hypothetical protein